jgi:primary-amine oxidase
LTSTFCFACRGRGGKDHAAFYDATLADDHGRAYDIPRAVALYERDGGLLWKHVDYPRTDGSRRGRELVLSWIANQGNYEYGFNWVFHQDGTLQMEALLIGIVLPKAVVGGWPVDDNHPPHGRMVAPHIEGVHHQHWFNFVSTWTWTVLPIPFSK